MNSEGVTVPAFLTEEQQAAYKNAHYALFWLYDVPGNLTEHGFSYAGENGVQITTADGYTLCNESYDKFVEYAHSIFTDDFLSGNEYYTKKFKSADGKLAMLESMIKPVVPGDWQQVEEDYPDTFRKESASDTKVVFRLISHYDANAKTTDTSNWSKEKMKVETIEYNITMASIADTYDAITADRPYRKGRSAEEALAEISRVSGTQLDERYVAIALADTLWTNLEADRKLVEKYG